MSYVLIRNLLQAYTGKALTLDYMNWTILLYGGTMFLAMSYYAISARKWFRGPRINVEHINTADDGSGRSHTSDEIIPKKE